MKDNGTRNDPDVLSVIRERLGRLEGRTYWRSLEELAETEEFARLIQREFPDNAWQWKDSLGRRNFLRLMGASLALAGVGACTRQPLEKIVPYVRQPEEFIPGRPLYYATAFPQGGFGQGVLVESHMGRPTKIEGNPDHPSSLGATNAFAQASVLSLYDPDRSQVIRRAGKLDTWDNFLAEMTAALEIQGGRQGGGLRFLTGTVTSPTLGDQIRQVLSRFPRAAWHQWEPAGRDNVREGARLAFGEYLETRHHFDKADVILSLDADFLYWGPADVRCARQFASGRRVGQGRERMNRLYVVEPGPSVTGGMADHRLAVSAGSIEALARRLCGEIGIEIPPIRYEEHASWIGAVAADLKRHQGSSLVVAGESQPPVIHAMAHAINHSLGNVGHTVEYTDPVEVEPTNQLESLRQLSAEMEAGEVELLIILGGNPVYNAPSDLDFAGKLAKVQLAVHLSQQEDETSALCLWHVPETHFLESWGDVRAFDGTLSIMQPLIAPLYGGKSAYEVLSVVLGRVGASSHDIVKAYWENRVGGAEFEKIWKRSIHDGVWPETALPARSPAPIPDVAPLRSRIGEGRGPDLELVFSPDPCLGDGRHANNGWLQELPKPWTKLTWGNAALISPRLAEDRGLRNGDVVRLTHAGQSIEAPIWVLPGQAEESVLVHLGHGRSRSGRVGNGVGFTAYPLRTSAGLWWSAGLKMEKTGRTEVLACTQNHHLLETLEASEEAERRHLVREGTLDEYRQNPDFVREMGHEVPDEMTLYPPHPYEGYAWGMSIDLSSCTGCNACVVACQSENNIPIVGKSEVIKGREMHWIRIDRYFTGPLDDPEIVHQPVACQHCENAPCEVVCPVAATTHSDEGLNEMTYNRCVGTRYCANNCPYKVRRFNFILYQDWETPGLQALRNPDVTVRSRGVMEKCTFCVQRISAARIEARNENRKIRDGEIQTACEAVCPSQAITFGDINDPQSRVPKLKANNLDYGILPDLNTRPRTTYQARLRNPNPELTNE